MPAISKFKSTGDKLGNVIHLGERDCSTQRRHQKLVEEAMAPIITEELRQDIRNAAVKLAENICYMKCSCRIYRRPRRRYILFP